MCANSAVSDRSRSICVSHSCRPAQLILDNRAMHLRYSDRTTPRRLRAVQLIVRSPTTTVSPRRREFRARKHAKRMARKGVIGNQVGANPRGRPREGLRPGERVRDYPTVTIRLPGETRELLKALCMHLDLPLWQTVRHLTVCFVRDLPAPARRNVVKRAKERG